MSEAIKRNDLAYAGAQGAGADECIVMISINGQTARPVGRNGCMDVLAEAMDHHPRATQITVNITTASPPTTMAEHPPSKKHRANSKSPPVAAANPAPACQPVPFKPASVDDIIDDAKEKVCALITETTADRSRWFGPTMPLKALATAASTALRAEAEADAADAMNDAAVLGGRGRDSLSTGSAPPSKTTDKLERCVPSGGSKKRALPPQKRYQRFNEKEWKTNIQGAVEAGFGRFKAVGDKRNTIGIIDSVLARVVDGAGKAEAVVLARKGVPKKPCFLVQRKKVGSKAPFHVKVSGTRMVAQKATFAAYNALEAHEIGTWQVEQSCCHNTAEWWCFEPSHLQRCAKDHVRPGSAKCAIPGEPHALLTS